MYTGNDPSTKVRLVTSSGEIGYADGRVQVLYNDTWKAICDNQWGVLDAQVICRMLCFKYVYTIQIIDDNPFFVCGLHRKHVRVFTDAILMILMVSFLDCCLHKCSQQKKSGKRRDAVL